MSIAISDALQQAQQDIERGDYRSAIQTCNRLVTQFPDYAAAYRVLGDAYLEQGQAAEAEQAFAQALLRDPRQAWAYHGLGLLAEEQNVLENALAFCQVAWELAPNYAQLREPVIRIAARRFGADGQAQLTSAALAQIYANTARLQRAATEYRAALNDLPDRVDLKLGLAETLWQLGKNDEAADLCRQVLEENPVAIQALIILSDIEARAGNSDEAEDLRNRVRAIDADGVIAATMLARNERADADSLLLTADAIPVLDDTAAAVVAERPHIAPAPDFSYQPAGSEQPVLDIEDLEPISAEEFGTDAASTGSVEDDAPSIYREEDDVLFDFGQELTADEEPVMPVEAEADAGVVAGVDVPVDDDLDALLAEFGDVEPMGIEEFGAEPEDVERLAASGDELLAGDDDMFAGLASPFPSAGGADEHVRNLASALEEDVAGALDRTGSFPTIEVEPEAEIETEPEVEAQVQEESPAPADPMSGTGYTTVLRDLSDEGLTPFDPMGRTEMQEASDQPDDVAAAASDDDALNLTRDWDGIDDEIARAVPLTTGQTDQLRAADDLGIAPFDFDIEDDTSRLPVYRPFGENDDELPELEALDQDATLEELASELETSEELHAGLETPPVEEPHAEQPETEEVEAAVEGTLESLEDLVVDESATEESPVAFEEPVTAETEEPVDDLLDNLEPFSLDEFEDPEESESSFSFGSLPWETGATGSAVPSDADLDMLLSSDDEPVLPVEEPESGRDEPDWATRMLDITPPETVEQVDWTTAIQDAEVAETEAASEPEPVPEPEPSPQMDEVAFGWDIPADWDTSLAVTRQIGGDQDDFAERLAAAEAAAQTEQPEVVEEDLPAETPGTSGLLSGVDPEKLVADDGLFERTRVGKTDLIASGAVAGDVPLEDEAEDVVIEPEPEPAPEPESEVQDVVEEAPVEDDFVVATGSTGDVATLRASLEAAPDDDELHWWLAEALRERGDVEEAYGEYRWLIRNAGHRADDIIESLQATIEDEQHAEMGHRLLADIYRRRGQVSLASNHAAAAMAVRRRLRG